MEVNPIPPRPRWRGIGIGLNVVIGILVVVIIYFSYSFLFPSSGTNNGRQTQNEQLQFIQIDVLNGCGISGAAMKFTDLLRQGGFDVVEIKNYSSFQIPNTIVIDRVGNRHKAQLVAAVLGLPENNIIQQINPDYFVDVSVVIGKDYSTLESLMNNKIKEKD